MERAQYIELYNTEKDHWWFRGRRKIISECLRLFCAQKVERALDIGCGTGFNAALLGNFSKNIFGLDFSDVAADLAKKLNPDFTLIKGEFPKIHLHEQYNIVTLLDVLEHIENDGAALKQIEELLAPGGLALITVPAFDFLWTEHDKLLHHKRRYTKTGLRDMIRSNTNLAINKLSYFNFFMFAPIFGFRALRKILNLNEGESDFFMLPKPLNYALEKIFSLEARALRLINFPFGVSVICVLQKPARSSPISVKQNLQSNNLEKQQ
ncbi:MAG: class I SAM-dependent methyltransferase [Candidatus Giovannonibacteria bacterium]|nr:MAG: class I SAM-dependent methyltransferase [Candidatus Giovannonibacteria bacterium]